MKAARSEIDSIQKPKIAILSCKAHGRNDRIGKEQPVEKGSCFSNRVETNERFCFV